MFARNLIAMTLASNEQTAVIRTEGGLTIAGTRIALSSINSQILVHQNSASFLVIPPNCQNNMLH